MTNKPDTSPARLRELANDGLNPLLGITTDKLAAAADALLAVAAEKEALARQEPAFWQEFEFSRPLYLAPQPSEPAPLNQELKTVLVESIRDSAEFVHGGIAGEFVDVPLPEPRRDAGARMEEGLRLIVQRFCHIYWGAGEPGCPEDIKAPNGELFKLRCKKCGEDNPKRKWCTVEVAQPSPADVPQSNKGHGHVRPRKDGYLARCGGPVMCKVCQLEMAEAATPAPADVPLPKQTHFPGWTNTPYYTTEQLLTHREAYAQAKVAAERERCLDVRLSDDDALRFACRVLESNAPEADKAVAREGLMQIRTRLMA